MIRAVAFGLIVTVSAERAFASGHGPVFGLATPTLGRGAFSLDFAAMGRSGDSPMAMVRPMLGYGITEDLQFSVSVPMPLYRQEGAKPARMTAMMPAELDVELLVGYRFHRTSPKVGARFESTAYGGFDYPTDDVRAGVRTAPGLYGALVTGYASRTIYAWVGALYRRYMTPTGETADHLGDLAMYSVVVGYRPAPFRKDYPHPDWRIFVEVVGGIGPGTASPGHPFSIAEAIKSFLGPTVLGLYGSWGISGGPAFRVYENLNGSQPEDRVRLVANFTYWF